MAPKVNPVKDFISGGVGGVCLVVAGHPFDTIKVAVQPTSKTFSPPTIFTHNTIRV